MQLHHHTSSHSLWLPHTIHADSWWIKRETFTLVSRKLTHNQITINLPVIVTTGRLKLTITGQIQHHLPCGKRLNGYRMLCDTSKCNRRKLVTTKCDTRQLKFKRTSYNWLDRLNFGKASYLLFSKVDTIPPADFPDWGLRSSKCWQAPVLFGYEPDE